jgi:tRNA G18 (ribose-2'-O)-methylase SpoU
MRLDLRRVESADDPGLSDYARLTDTALRRRREPAEGMFIAEGAPVVERALRAGYPLRSLLCDERWIAHARDLLEEVAGLSGAVPCYVGSGPLLEALTGYHVHRGMLAAFARRALPDLDQLLTRTRRLVVVEDSNNPTNLGAVFRCAAGLGMDAVLLSPRCADPLYRRCVRVSMGQVFALPYARAGRWPDDLARVRAAGFTVLALSPRAEVALGDVAAAGLPDRVAVLVGAEESGLSPEALSAADRQVRIPMAAGVDSLNVGAAAAVACYLVGTV